MDYEKKYKEALERARQFSEKPYLEDSKGIVDYIFPELKESEDEKIRKALIQIFNVENFENYDIKNEEVIAWLEKQGEHAKFCDSIQVGDKVTRNEDGVLVNLSQLKRVAKKDEKQGEQKPAAWSEEDERMLENTIGLIEVLDRETRNAYTTKEYIDWLKSLRPQSQWKPSDYQIEALESATENCAYSEYQDCLRELIGQLKKLKE